MEALVVVHSWLRWLVLVALLGGGAYGLIQAPRKVPFDPRPFRAGAVVFDLQAAIGIVLYLGTAAWESNPFMRVIHPVVMLAAVAVAHVALAAARRRGAAESGGLAAYRIAGVWYLFALILVALAIPWAR